jgi:putative transposase
MPGYRFYNSMHRRHSLRLSTFDYNRAGTYFLTICSFRKEFIFGEIDEQAMRLNENGEIVKRWWCALPDRFQTIRLDEMVIMPNHVHGILTIQKASGQNASPCVGAIHELPLQKNKTSDHSGLRERRRMLLARALGYFKMNSAKEINRLRDMPGAPVWQRNYYERIIREDELIHIRKYIRNNPQAWGEDEENPACQQSQEGFYEL